MTSWESLGRNWMKQKLPVVLHLPFGGLYGYVCHLIAILGLNLYNEFLHFCFCRQKLTKIQRSGCLQNVHV